MKGIAPMQIFKKILYAVLFFLLLSSVSVMAADKGNFSVKPSTNGGKNGGSDILRGRIH